MLRCQDVAHWVLMAPKVPCSWAQVIPGEEVLPLHVTESPGRGRFLMWGNTGSYVSRVAEKGL